MFKLVIPWMRAAAIILMTTVAASAVGQTLATGDSRTVTETQFPAVCTVVTAQQAIVSGGPASETTYDTSRIQTALNGCASGKAVELARNGTNYAFLSGPLNIPSGVGLLIDGGITLFASRKASDYQISGAEMCGSYGSGGGCSYFFTFPSGASGSGIYGYGVIDLRGEATILNSSGADTGVSWWQNADTAVAAGKTQDNPALMRPESASNLTLYKITVRNSPFYNVTMSDVNGMTVWGAKIQAPFTARNTDGIDPWGTNVTISNTYISDGDDAVAVNSPSTSPTANVSVIDSNIYSSQGVSIGSYTKGGVSNVLVKNVNFAGDASDPNDAALRIKSAADRGGLVQNVTYENICMRDVTRMLRLDPFFNSNSGTSYPTFQNIVLSNVHGLTTTGTISTYVEVRGYDSSHLSTVTFDNVVFDQLDFDQPGWEYATVALAGNVYPSKLAGQTGTDLTYTGSATHTATPAYDCSATDSVFPATVGELYVATPSANSQQSVTVPSGTAVTLHAMLQPTRSQTSYSGALGTATGAPALTASVKFYEGSALVGSGTLGSGSANNTLATLVLTGMSVGTHIYTAEYPGDANYPAQSFGSVSVTVTGTASVTPSSLSFPDTGVGVASPTSTLAVTNGGGGSLSFTASSISNGFSIQQSDCTASLAANATCHLTIAFQPAVAGPVSGTLALSDSSGIDIPSVDLAGTGVDFLLTTVGPDSVQLSSGGSAAFTLQLSSLDSLTGAVTLACSGLPSDSKCQFSPSVLALGGDMKIAVTVQTGVQSASHRKRPNLFGGNQAMELAMFAPLGALLFRRRKFRRHFVCALGCAVAVTLSGCGSGSSKEPGGPSYITPTGNYTVVVAGSASGISRSVQLHINVQ